MRQLLDRIDDSATGECAEEFNIPVPDWKMKEAEHMAALVSRSQRVEQAHPGLSSSIESALS